MKSILFHFALLGLALAAGAQARDAELEHSQAQLADSVGEWDVRTDFLNRDGTVARSVQGSYKFRWVVPDRVVGGTSEIPELKQVSGILFYINAAKRQVEMVSVGADGNLWIMTGPLGGEVRTSREFRTTGGATRTLRFTRFNVMADSFDSKMEYTDDGGKTWHPGNHQHFRRARPRS